MIIYRTFSLIAIGVFMSTTLLSQGWRGVVPFESTRVDVEQMFGRPDMDLDYTVTYKLKDEELSIDYSLGRCGESTYSQWDVSKDVVIGISVNPVKFTRFSDFGLSRDDFKIFEISKDLPGYYLYKNENTGRTFEIDTQSPFGKDAVASFGFYGRKDQQPKRCPAHK